MCRSGGTLSSRRRSEDDPDDDVGPAPVEKPNDEDLDLLSLHAESVMNSMEFEIKHHNQAFVDLRKHTEHRCQRLRNMGCDVLREVGTVPRPLLGPYPYSLLKSHYQLVLP